MAERYSKLFSLSSGLYTNGSPILISAGALLKDNETNWLICQLKLHSLSEKTIKFVKAEITCLDSVGRQLDEPIIAEYLDLSISRGEDFGTQIPVKISIQATRSYTVRVVEVGFSDNDIWSDNFNDWIAVPSQSPIEHILKNDNAIKGYKSTFGNSANMAYNECGDLWLCSCGNANYTSENQCFKCNALRDALKDLDENSLEKEGIYSTACNMANSNDIVTLQNAIKEFNKLTNYKDSSILAKKCDEKIIDLKNAKKSKNVKRNKIIKTTIIAFFALVLTALFVWFCTPIGTYSYTPYGDGYSISCNKDFIRNAKIPSKHLGKPVVRIDELAFAGAKIKTVTIPDSVTSIGHGAFSHCESLKSIEIPDSVTSIEEGVFLGCESLKSIEIPDGVTRIHWNTFTGCSSLTRIGIGASVTSIGSYVFEGCTSLVDVYYNGDVAKWVNIDFDSHNSNPMYYGVNLYINNEIVTNIVVPDSVKSINDYAFYHCKTLNSIEISNSVTNIGASAFAGCTSLTNIVISDSVKSIDDSAFRDCTSLMRIVIPNSVTSMGSYVFSDCTSLEIYCKAKSKPSGWDYFWNNSNRPVVWNYIGK